MQQTRRTFLAGVVAGPLLLATAETTAQRAARLIRAYDQQGIHRTGTAGDQRSARWLAGEVQRLGVQPQLESFSLQRVDPQECALTDGKERWPGLPLFDAPFANSVSGKLGAVGSEAEIGLIELPPNAEYGATYEALRRASRHRALLFITKGTRPGLCPINAAWFTQPFGPPVLQVSSEFGPPLQQRFGKTVTLTMHVKRSRTQAQNITATTPASRRWW